MYDLAALPDASDAPSVDLRSTRFANASFHATKRLMDLVVSLALLPPTLIVALVVLAVNPFFNPGPLFYTQTRMGRNCKPFKAYKFRSMRVVQRIGRNPDDPLEQDRITPFGRFLRKSRFDELPQILNVLRGDMSLIGPRPDYIGHARRYLRDIPGYRERHLVRPGISGLAQTEFGYAEGYEATARKVQYDLYYIANTNPMLEAWIFWRTLTVVARRMGA